MYSIHFEPLDAIGAFLLSLFVVIHFAFAFALIIFVHNTTGWINYTGLQDNM